MRRSLKGVMGQEKYDRYFNGFLEHFFTEKDAEFFASVRSVLSSSLPKAEPKLTSTFELFPAWIELHPSSLQLPTLRV